MMKGFEKVELDHFLNFPMRGEQGGIVTSYLKKDVKERKEEILFSQRVANSWNGLPQDVIDADTVNCFKNRLD